MVDVDLTIGPPGAPEVEESALGPAPDSETPEIVPHIDESIVRALLKGSGGALRVVIGDPDVEDHWRFEEEELDAVVPPLTRIINRRPALARAVARGDEATVALTLASYAGRNMTAGTKAKKERKRANVQREAGEAGGGETPGDRGKPRQDGGDGDSYQLHAADGGGVSR